MACFPVPCVVSSDLLLMAESQRALSGSGPSPEGEGGLEPWDVCRRRVRCVPLFYRGRRSLGLRVALWHGKVENAVTFSVLFTSYDDALAGKKSYV